MNEEWISDKTRHVVDGLRTQRLDQPYIRENGRLRPATWTEAFAAIAAKVKGADGKRIGALAGDLAAVEEMFALKALMASLGSSNIDCALSRLAARPEQRPRQLSVQFDHCRHRAGRRAADRRLQSAQGSGGAQCPHPQALARRQFPGRPDRRERRSHLHLRLSRRRPGERSPVSAKAISPKPSRRRSVRHSGRRRRAGAARWRGGRFARRQDGASSSARSRTAGTASTSCTRRPRAPARSISASCRARAASIRLRCSAARRSTCFSCSAPMRSRCRRALSSSISARMATAARIAPT